MRGRVLLAVAAVTIGALAVPAAASAAGPKIDGLTLVSFNASASDGYRLMFSAFDGPGKRTPQASFSFNHAGLGVTYTVHAKSAIKGNRIEGDFGDLGSFSGTFSGEIKDGKGCKPFIHRNTEFSGKLEVEGEHGFASAKLRNADGRIMALVKDPDCVTPEHKRKPPVKPEQVQLQACPSRGTVLYAHLDRRRERSGFQASTFERRGKLLISRIATDDGEEGDFDIDADLERGTLTPGGPFAGSASYADGELTGDLTVTQLGLTDPVALTPAPAGVASGRGRPDC